MKLSQSIGHANIVQTRSNQTWFIIQILQYQYQYRPELDDWPWQSVQCKLAQWTELEYDANILDLTTCLNWDLDFTFMVEVIHLFQTEGKQ